MNLILATAGWAALMACSTRPVPLCRPSPGRCPLPLTRRRRSPRSGRHRLPAPTPAIRPSEIPIMCGLVGIVGNENVAGQLYDALAVLQHRGQDAAGIATADGTRLRVHKDNGLVRDVFSAKAMSVLQGRVGIAHCRYPTAGSEGM